MLDEQVKTQLNEVFQRLEQTVRIRVSKSAHEAQSELLVLLEELAACSSKISIEPSGAKEAHLPTIEIQGAKTQGSVSFRGVPGGHEFSSLVIAILNADGKGRLPDEGLQGRIRKLKGPAQIKTYVSLSCENCPEVIQALNLIATLHPAIKHEMIDGGLAQDEVGALGIQGVPSVFVNEKLTHSGKASLLDLLTQLENSLGTNDADAATEVDLGSFDVAVIGGGPAGVSAAIYSARKGLKTALIAEKMGGQVQETKGIENMISIPYTEGQQLTAHLNQHLNSYPVTVLEHRRVREITGEGPRILSLEGGERLDARSVVVATGAKWRQLGIPGEKEYLGTGVAFCAHCDGPFYKNKHVAVVGGGNSGVEAAIDLAGIATSVVLLEYGEKLRADEVLVNKLKALPNARVLLQARSTQVLGDGKKVTGLEYLDRSTEASQTLSVDGIFVQIGLLPNSQFIKGLVETTPSGEIVVDAKGRTSQPGIYAAGDVTTVPFKQIVIAMGEGAKVALTAFEDRMYASVSTPSQTGSAAETAAP